MKCAYRIGASLVLGLGPIFLASCSAGTPEVSRGRTDSEFEIDSTVPQLVRIERTIPDTNSPPSSDTDHSVFGPGSTIFFRPPASGGLAGIVIDSLGQAVAEFGRLGAGPNEFQLPMRMLSSSSGDVVVFDAGLLRATTIDARGRTVRSLPVQVSALPIGIVGDSLDFAQVKGRAVSVFRWDGKGQKRMLLTDSTPAFAAEPGFATPSPNGRSVIPVFGSDGYRIAVGDPWNYTVLLFKDDGSFVERLHRDLPVPRRTERQVLAAVANRGRWRGPSGEQLASAEAETKVRAEVLPYFSHVSPFAFDAGHRLWIVGVDGDSVFADVFAGSKFLTRIGIPCFDFSGRWSLHGEWLSLACGAANAQEETPNPTFQLYRIR